MTGVRGNAPSIKLLGGLVLIVALAQVAAAQDGTDGFLANAGRLDPRVRYYGSGSGVDVFFTDHSVVFDVKDAASRDLVKAAMASGEEDRPLLTRRGQALVLTFPGAREAAELVAGGEEGPRHNFFFGQDPRQWRRGEPSYRSITYRGLWDGVDLVFSLERGHLSYKLIGPATVARLEWSGASGMRPTDAGTELETPYGTLVDDGSSIERRVEGDALAPAALSRDASALLWSTLIGGVDTDEGTSLAIASNGDVVVVGETLSPDFPGTAGAYEDSALAFLDIFVSRFSSDGSTLVWSSFLGASNWDYAMSIKLDADDNPIIVGRTSSSDYPTTAGAYDPTYNGEGDCVVSKLSSDGASLIFSTFVGGSLVDGFFDIVPNSAGEWVCAGYTASSDYPTDPTAFQPTYAGPTYDAMVSILSADGSTLVASSYLGGSERDAVRGVAVDSLDNVYLAGFSVSDDFPVTAGAFQTVRSSLEDAVLVKLDSHLATMLWGTFLGGDDNDRALCLNVDSHGNPLFAGYSQSTDFPTSPGVVQPNHYPGRDGIVAKFDGDDGSRIWSTYLGGEHWEDLVSLTVGAMDTPVVAGWTQSPNFPVRSFGYDTTHHGVEDVVVSRLAADASDVLWGTFLGGSGTDHGLEVVLDANDHPFVTGTTTSLDFPVSAGAYDQTPAGGTDAMVAGFDSGDARISVVLSDSLIACGLTTTAAFSFHPDLPFAPELRSYSVRLHAPAGLSFDATDVTVLSPLVGVNDAHQVVDNGPGDVTIEFQFLDPGIGLGVAAELFHVVLTGSAEGAATLALGPSVFRDLEDRPFQVVSVSSAAIDVDCTAPVSQVSALPPSGGSSFDIPFTASDAASGVASVEIFYNFQGGAFVSLGSFTASPVPFVGTDGDGIYGFYTVATDGAGNVEAAPPAPDATILVDTVGPTGAFTINDGAALTNDPAVTLNLAVVGAVEMRFSNDNLAFTEGWVPYATTHAWTIAPDAGTATVFGEFRDVVGSIWLAQDTIGYDGQPTGPTTEFAATRGHQLVSLVWQDPAEADLDHVEIWRGILHGENGQTSYPDFDHGTIPTAPASRAAAMADPAWHLAGSVGGGAEAFVDTVATRGIYYYEIFAVDTAGNFSPPSGQLPAATNYVLGDIAQPFDGHVFAADVGVLDGSYGLLDGDAGFDKHADIGPTSDHSGWGLPQPDDVVDFEDLMIVALNHELSSEGIDEPDIVTRGRSPVSLGWFRASASSYVLRLLAPGSGLKGLNISAPLPVGVTATVTAGTLCNGQAQPVFVRNIAAHGVDAGLALLGVDQVLIGVGDLLVVTLSAGADPQLLDLENLTLSLRNRNNEELDYTFDAVSAVEVPSEFALGKNFPNPFNPTTRISFSLPTPARVQLEIFNLNGGRIAILVDETLASGYHQITWNGQDDAGRNVASGTYFYRIRAGEYTAVDKMTLLK